MLKELPTPRTETTPIRLFEETGESGLNTPFILLGMTPASESDSHRASQAAKKAYILSYSQAVTEQIGTLDSPQEFGINNNPKNTPDYVILDSRQTALDFLYADQAGTLQPLLVNTVLQGFLDFCQTQGVNKLQDHGGGTRRLVTLPRVYKPREGRNDRTERIDDQDGYYPTFFRFKGQALLEKPNNETWLDKYEEEGKNVLSALTRPHNLDLKAEIASDTLPLSINNVTSRIRQFLVVQKDTAGEFHEFVSGEEDIVEFHMTNWKAFWHPHALFGYLRPQGYATSHVRNEPYVFNFGPEQEIDKYVIQIKAVHPQGNPDWNTIRISFGVAGKNGFLDMRHIYFSPTPTGQLLQVDQRAGAVNSLQNNFVTEYHIDGSVRIPESNSYHLHDPKLPEDFFTLKGGDINKLSADFGRLIRYGVFGATLIDDEDLALQFPENKSNLIDSLQQLNKQINLLLTKGQRISPHKRTELLADLAVAICTNSFLSVQELLRGIRPTKTDQVQSLFPHSPLLYITRPFFHAGGRHFGHSDAIVWDDDRKTLHWDSQIDYLIDLMDQDLWKDYNNGLPKGSLMARFCWLFDPDGGINFD